MAKCVFVDVVSYVADGDGCAGVYFIHHAGVAPLGGFAECYFGIVITFVA